MISALIIDDELLARENLKILIQDFCTDITVIGMASNIKEAKTLIETLKPKVIFLDIRMPSGAEGFDLLDSFETINFEIVFVTAFKDYAIQAFKANAIDYVLKPVEIDELIATTNRIKARLANKTQVSNHKEIVQNTFRAIHNKKIERITLSHQKGLKIIEVANIIRLEAHSNYTELFFRDGSKFMDTKTLKTYQEILPKETFLRVHNSHIINVLEIDELLKDQGNILVLKNKSQLPVSRTYLPILMEYFNSL